MSDLFRRAESILDVASAPGAESDGTVIVLDRAGHLRMLSPGEWTLPALVHEFGAREVYMVRNRAGSITVEAWSATDRCTISRKQAGHAFSLTMPTISGCYAARSQMSPQLAK